jgi:dolichyl-phosphate beta-glucosyltransferase
MYTPQHQHGLRSAGPVGAWNRAAASQQQHPASMAYRSPLAVATIGTAALESMKCERSTPALSVIIPAYNEEERLPGYLEQVIQYFSGRGLNYEVIVVNDGSGDNTKGIVAGFQSKHPQVILHNVPVNRGKGNAVREGMRISRGARVLFTDADGATPIDQYERLEREMESSRSHMVIGSRQTTETTEINSNLWRRFVGRVFNVAVQSILLPGIKDTQCGFKLFTNEAAKFLRERQTEERFSFDVEQLTIAKRAHIPVREVAVNWSDKPGSKVNVWRDGLKMFVDLVKFKWTHRTIKAGSFKSGEGVE